jgi:glutaminyl-peptide cyclotransferase
MALDISTLHAWDLILRVFFAEYLGLRPEPSSKRGEPSSPTHPFAPVRKSDTELVRFLPPGMGCF